MMSDQHGCKMGDGLNLKSMETMRNHHELFRADCSNLICKANTACKRMQREETERLDQRVRDIKFVKKELELKLEEIIGAIDNLLVLKNRVSKALEANDELLKVTVLCLEERKKRFPSERCHDEVDQELIREREDFEKVRAVLQPVLQQIYEQIRLNRSAKYHLEHNLQEKFEAQEIDNLCILMSAHTIKKPEDAKNSPVTKESLAVTPEQWENISEIQMVEAEHQKTNTLSLHALVDSLLKQTAADMQRQVQATKKAFCLNIQDIKSAKSQMEEQLAKISSEVASQKKTREDLQVAIDESERSLSLANARLESRRQRPGIEQCFDPAQAQLLSSVQELTANINILREAVARSEESQWTMVQCQLELEENIEFKTHSLYIDEVVCTQHREAMTVHNF